jgi:3-oxoacyl-(acyl-carrier-protein) synthase
MNARNRVTGLGLVTAAGSTVAENYANFMAKKSGIALVTRFELPTAKVRTNFAGLLPAIDPSSIPADLLTRLNEEDLSQDYVKAAVMATAEAVDDAGVAAAIRAAPRRTGLLVASSLGNFLHVSELVKDYFMKALYKITSMIHGMNSYLPSKLGSLFGVRGPCCFVSSSCTSALNALLQADTLIRAGVVDRVLVVGVDVCLETGTFHLWNKIRLLSHRNDSPETACRPYCQTRDGIVVAEAAACFVVEAPAVAARQGYGVIEGIGMANGSADFLKPSPALLEAAIAEAVQNSRVPIGAIDFIAGSASGSPFCDHFESEAICRVFGPRAAEVPLFSYKSFLGSTFGVQALSEGALALTSMHRGEIPEVRNVCAPDERIKAHAYYDFKAFRGGGVEKMLFINYGFAGNHMAIVYSRPTEEG